MLLPCTAFALGDQFAEAYNFYKKGAYIQTIEALQKVRSKNKEVRSTKHYLNGLANNRLQNYDQSVSAFGKALSAGNKSSDIFYEYGQALYASNDLEKAITAFKNSFSKKYKKSTSLYYMGHISQILEEHRKAKKYFSQILREKDADLNIKQIAYYQRTESMLVLAREKKDTENIVENIILPHLKKAKMISPDTDLAGDIEKRKKELWKEFSLNPNKFKNGKSIPKKKLNLSFTQKVKYNNNVTTSNDQQTVSATQKDSYIFDSSMQAKYNFILKRRVKLTPSIKFTNVRHSDRDSATVFTNDNWIINPGLNTAVEHTLFKKRSSFLFNYSYSHKEQDRESKHEKILYARTNTFTIGQKIKFFSFGDTSIKHKRKYYRAYAANLYSNTETYSIDQVALLPSRHLLIALFSIDLTDSFNDPTESTDSYLVRFDYLAPNILPDITLSGSFSTTFLDTLSQSATRGTEMTYSPGIKVAKKAGKHLKVTLAYDYTKKTSDDISKEYTQHVTTFQVKYTF